MKKHIRNIIIFYILFSLCISFTPMFDIPIVRAGSTYYVSTTGDDSTGAGSIGNPWATIQKALNLSGDGDTVYVRGGNYNNIYSPTTGLRLRHNNFTLSGYENEVAVINGNGYDFSSGYALLMIGSCSSAYDCDNVTIQNLVFENSTDDLIKATSCGTGVSDNITLSNLTVNNATLRGINFWSSDSFTHSINNIVVEDCFINNTQTKRPLSLGEGITFRGVQNVTFRNNIVMNCPKIMLDFVNNTKNVACYNNTFVNNVSTSIKVDGSQTENPSEPCYVSNVSIYNNLFYGTGQHAIFISGEKYGGADNITIYNNIINLSNATEGINAIKLAYKTAPYLSTLDNISVTYNTIYVKNATTTTGVCLQIEIPQDYATNFIIANNIFISSEDTNRQVSSSLSNFTDSYLHFHNNTYNHTSKVPDTYWNGVTHQFESSAINASPEFVDIATYNLHLNSTSPCIDNATSNYTVATDFGYASRPQGSDYDVGAYEFIQSSWSGTLFEYYDGPPYGGISIGGPTRRAQTFTVGTVGSNIDHTIESVGLRLFRFSNLDIVHVNITAVDGDGKPTGTNLSWGNTNTSGLTQTSFGQWRVINMTSYVLQHDTKYAIVANSDITFGWTYGIEPLYAGGSYGESSDSGSTWTMNTSRDFMFRVYGKGVINITDHSPITGVENVSNVNTVLSVAVNHTEGESMTVKWYSNSSGIWTLLATNITTGNEVVYQTNTDFSEYGTIYYWNVSVQEGSNILYSDIYWFRTLYAPENPTNINTTYISPSLNITWTAGKYADSTVVVKNNNSEPANSTDGWIAYNGTLLYYNDTDVYNLSYFKLFSYNSTNNLYSSGVSVDWGGMEINVYNESDNSSIASWNVFITNQTGTETYEFIGATNPHTIDLADLPLGDNIAIQINATGYKARYYYMDLNVNEWYDLNAYLPPENVTHLYVLIVNDDYDNPVVDARVQIQRYINESVGFENLSVLITDSSGKVSLYLIEDTYHKVIISKEGYETEIADYHTDPDYYGVYYPEYFKIKATEPDIITVSFSDVCVFTGEWAINNSLSIYFLDSYDETSDVTFRIYESYNETLTEIELRSWGAIDEITFYNTSTLNTSRMHEIRLEMNHTTLGHIVNQTIYVMPLRPDDDKISGDWIENMLEGALGEFDYGYVNFGLLFVPCFVFIVLGGVAGHPGLGIIITGGYVALFNWRVLVSNVEVLSILITLFLMIGFIVIISKKGRGLIK